MRASDIRDMPDDGLRARLRKAKRELARALTIARERGVDPNVKAEADNG